MTATRYSLYNQSAFLFSVFLAGFISSSAKDRIFKNEEIRASEVRVIGDEGEQLGVFPLRKALDLAFSKELDLVEISPQANPPVCKIMDFGSYLYQKKKEVKDQKKKQKVQSVKEIKFGIRISDHDFGVRISKVSDFLTTGHPVRVILQFRGREQSHADIGFRRLEEMRLALEQVGKQEFVPKEQGRSVVTEFRPLKK